MSIPAVTANPIEPSIPFFVIRGDECCITWLIKQIMLWFQCCIAEITITTYVNFFSEANIRWLTNTQIQGLPEESISQLALNQLNAFSQAQRDCFSDSQRAAFEQALRTFTENHEVAGELVNESGPLQLPQIPSAPVHREREVNPLEQTLLKDYLRDPAVRESVDRLLSEKDREFLTNPLVREFVSSYRDANKFNNYSLSMDDVARLRRALLNSCNVNGFLNPNALKPEMKSLLLSCKPEMKSLLLSCKPEMKSLLLSCLSDEAARLLTDPELQALRSNSQFLSSELSDLEMIVLMVKSERQLLDKTVSDLWTLDRDTIQYSISVKCNGWIGSEILTMIEQYAAQNDFANQWSLLWNSLRSHGTPLDIQLFSLSAIQPVDEYIKRFAIDSYKAFNPGNYDIPEIDTTDLESHLTTLRDFEALTAEQFFNLSLNKVHQFLSVLRPIKHAALRATKQVNDESIIDAESVKLLTLEQFRYLSPAKINSLAPDLPKKFTGLLSREQLRGLDISCLTEKQIKALIALFEGLEPSFVDIFSPAQIREMQPYLTGKILGLLSEEQTQALDTEALEADQVNSMLRPDMRAILAKFSVSQIPGLQAKLSGTALRLLTEDQTRALDTATLTVEQISTNFEGLFWFHHEEHAAKFTPAQIRAMQTKLHGDILQDITIEQTHALDAAALTDEQLTRIFWGCSGKDRLSKFLPEQIGAMQSHLSGSLLKELSNEQAQALDVDALTDVQLQGLFENPVTNILYFDKFTQEQQTILQPRLQDLGIVINT